MESQPQNPEFKNNPENFHPCNSVSEFRSYKVLSYRLEEPWIELWTAGCNASGVSTTPWRLPSS